MNAQQQKREWLAEKLRMYAAAKATNMRGIANILGVSPQYLSGILNGHKSVTKNFLTRIENMVNQKFTEITPTPAGVVNENGPTYNLANDYINELKNDKQRLLEIITDLRTILKQLTK